MTALRARAESIRARLATALTSGREVRRALGGDARRALRGVDHAGADALRLQAVTAGLAAAATTDDIADVVIREGIPALDASTGILGLLEQGELRFVRTLGYADVFPERLPLDAPWPVTTAAREQRLIELRDLDERRAHFTVPDHVWDASGHGTLVAVPLVVGGRSLGALGFTRDDPSGLSDDERRLVETLARQAAQALDRAALLEADRRARLQAEALQRVTSAVATAPTIDDVANAIATEALAVLDAAGVTVVLSRTVDPTVGDVLASRGSVAAYAAEEPHVNLRGGTVTAEAIRTQRAIFVETSEALLAGWPSSAVVAQELGICAVACIPFRVGQRLGALSVVTTEARQFESAERSFLALLARVCEQGLLRAALFEAEHAARRRAEILQGLAATLSVSAGVTDVGNAFLEHAVDHLHAGSGALTLVDPSGSSLVAAAIGGSGSTRSSWLESLPVDGEYVISTAFRRGVPVFARTRDELEARFPATATNFGEGAKAAYARPLAVGGRTIGAFGLVFEEDMEVSAENELLLGTMADLCAQAIERARMYDTEHQIASRLQRAMLPTRIVRHPLIDIAASYEAGTEAMVIGGDWYDTFALSDGRVGLAVGDVVGQGIEAAAAMGRLRSALAAYALDAHGPADLVTRLGRFVTTPGVVEFATVCYAVLDPASGKLVYASAGHPPMLVVSPDGETRWLTTGRTQALCGGDGPALVASEAVDEIEPGSIVLLYSDGLVERRGEHIDAGLARLERAARELRDLPLQDLCEQLVAELRAGGQVPDDTVVLAVRPVPVESRVFRRSFPARADELRIVRGAARDWLEARSIPPSERDDILLALGEACANAVEHAYMAHQGDVEVEITNVDDDLTVSVRDHGAWRDENRPVAGDEDRGRGYTIMRSVSDSVDVDAGPDGTTVTIHFAGGGGEA